MNGHPASRSINDTRAATTPAQSPSAHELPVLRELIAWSRTNGSAVGYFAALYLHTGQAVDDGLKRGIFRTPELLARVNDVFFGRYETAVDAFRSGLPTSASWAAAFEAAGDPKLTVLQHLMLGMNAHINFDLAIAVVEAVPADQLEAFHSDFQTMNKIFSGLVQQIAAELAVVWWPLGIVNRYLHREDQRLVDLGMLVVRDEAWDTVRRLARHTGAARDQEIAGLDARTTALAQALRRPGRLLTRLVRVIRRGEHGSVAEILDDLVGR
jgi:hypothetical protein